MKKNKTQLYLVIVFALALLIGVGYALLTSNLNIFGTTTISKASWDVHFENLNVTSGSIEAETPATIDANKTTVNYTVSLNTPGDFYEFSVDEVNKGTIDAMISSIVKTGITEEQAKYLDYTVSYSDGSEVKEKQLLTAGEKETVRVRVEFKKDITASDLPTTETTLNLSFSINYVQSDNSAVAVIHPVCKRATTLHTEVCNQTSTSAYCSGTGYKTGDTITYGNLGTAGTLTSGDAFDCDVNGDKTFDPATERFYYVSDKDADSSSDYVTLIYYSNVSEGVADNNTTKYAYNTIKGTNTNYEGPVIAKSQLPTTSQWKNVGLASPERDITDETGAVKGAKFSYANYAARLLTAQEVNRACGITIGGMKAGELDNCQYLMENTKYTNNSLVDGYWLESVSSSNGSGAWKVIATSRIAYYFRDTVSGVRPAIEVEKTKIKY